MKNSPYWLSVHNMEPWYVMKCSEAFQPGVICNIFVHAGQSETDTDKLCSILAQLEYQYLIGDWEAQGVPFKSQLYVP